MEPSTAAVVYTRISLDREKNHLAVERQFAECSSLAKQLGWEVGEHYSDNSVSAYKQRRRPEFERLLEDMAQGKVTALLIWHPDRLYRKPADLERIVAVCEQNKVVVRTVMAGELDLGTASGRQVARILGAVSRGESERMVERMRSAYQQQAANGRWRSRRRVFGYKLPRIVIEDGKQRTVIEVEPIEAEAIRKAARDVLLGVSLRRITREWNKAGLRTTGTGRVWASPGVSRTLVNPRYAALSEYHGTIVGAGTWPRILTEDEHHALVAYLTNPDRTNQAKGFERKYFGSGVYRCGRCDARLTTSQKSTGLNRRIYVCSASKHLSRQGEALDQFVEELVLGRLNMPDARLVLTKRKDVDLPALLAERAGLEARQAELAGLFAEGSVTGPQLKSATATLSEKVAKLTRRITEATTTDPVAVLLTEDVLEDAWDRLSPEVKGRVIEALMTVTVLPAPLGLRRFDTDYIDIQWRANRPEH